MRMTPRAAMMCRLAIVIACGLALPLAAFAAPPAWVHPFAIAQVENAPAEALLVVEIPAGGFTKYEMGEDGLLHVDRFIAMPMAYPANYGSMPRTLAGDGDPLDALVLTRAPLHPGSVIRFRPLGVLRMVDGGEADEKIIGVPVDEVDASYAGMRELKDLPAQEIERIEAFFRVYKDLPVGSKRIELNGWGDADEARSLIREAIDAAGAKPRR